MSHQIGFVRRVLLLAGLCLWGALGQVPVRAWNPAGHMAVAGVAYDSLSPPTKAAVGALLARHRDYALWMKDLPAGSTDRARYAFLRAAVWPDDVRQTPDDRPNWHYADVSVIVPGYTLGPAAVRPASVSAETQLPAEARILADPTATAADRAVALCWVAHLVGDVHQPLHDASLFSATFPQGDKGGNRELLSPDAVADDPREAAVNLHTLWDDLLGETRDPAQIRTLVARLEAPTFARRTYPQLARHKAVHDWVLEGYALARDVVYLGGKLPSRPDGAKAGVSLPPGYLATAHRVADRQAALAGLRLADLLNQSPFPRVSVTAATPSTVTPPPPALVVASGPFIGNRRTHAYHRPGEAKTLPSERNRVYFGTEEAAQKAGYHPAGPVP